MVRGTLLLTVESNARHHVDMLAFHWLTSLACLDKAGVHDRRRINEVSLIEPMTSFFSYGLLRAPNQKEQECFRPRATFGIRTNLVDASSESSAQVSLLALSRLHSLHLATVCRYMVRLRRGASVSCTVVYAQSSYANGTRSVVACVRIRLCIRSSPFKPTCAS